MSNGTVTPAAVIRQKGFGVDSHLLVGRNISFQIGKQKKQFFIFSIESDVNAGTGNVWMALYNKNGLKDFQNGQEPARENTKGAILLSYSAKPGNKNLLTFDEQTVPFNVLGANTVPQAIRQQLDYMKSFPIGETLQLPLVMEKGNAPSGLYHDVIIHGHSFSIDPSSKHILSVIRTADEQRPSFQSSRSIPATILLGANIVPIQRTARQGVKEDRRFHS